MLENKRCPNCGTVQVGLNLKETNGSFICSKCKRHFIVEGENIKEVKEEKIRNNKNT